MQISFTVKTDAFKTGIDNTRDRFDQAFATSLNMVASMMKEAVTNDIAGAGKFGSDYTDQLSVTVEGTKITTRIDAPGAALFERGGVIHGKPLLWLPISGTDAEGIQASNYGDKLFSVNRKAGGVPLLFSVKDHAPKYFGVPSVTISKKFHIAEIEQRVMAGFREIFDNALGAANG